MRAPRASSTWTEQQTSSQGATYGALQRVMQLLNTQMLRCVWANATACQAHSMSICVDRSQACLAPTTGAPAAIRKPSQGQGWHHLQPERMCSLGIHRRAILRAQGGQLPGVHALHKLLRNAEIHARSSELHKIIASLCKAASRPAYTLPSDSCATNRFHACRLLDQDTTYALSNTKHLYSSLGCLTSLKLQHRPPSCATLRCVLTFCRAGATQCGRHTKGP